MNDTNYMQVVPGSEVRIGEVYRKYDGEVVYVLSIAEDLDLPYKHIIVLANFELLRTGCLKTSIISYTNWFQEIFYPFNTKVPMFVKLDVPDFKLNLELLEK